MTARPSPRPPELTGFLDVAAQALDRHATEATARRAVALALAALAEPGPASEPAPGSRLPVVGAHLGPALDAAAADPALAPLITRFRALEPCLTWRPRASGATASAGFPEGHANAMIVGPGGLEPRDDVWLGMSLLAPHVRYPDHDHAPEEVYLVLSDGEFRQGDGDWFRPGPGGSFHNSPGIRHAMRSGDVPLLALWILRA